MVAAAILYDATSVPIGPSGTRWSLHLEEKEETELRAEGTADSRRLERRYVDTQPCLRLVVEREEMPGDGSRCVRKDEQGRNALQRKGL